MARGGEQDRIVRGLGIAGRRAELEQLSGVLDSVESGASVVQVFEGATGAGKTKLLGAATAFAQHRGFVVGEVATSVVEQPVPFSVAVQLCENVLAQMPENGAGKLARTLPEFGFNTRGGAFGHVLETSGESNSLPMILALNQVLDEFVRRSPLVLVIDDLQWCDVPTLRWLAHVARRMRHAPLALLLSRTSGVRTQDPLLVADLVVSARRIKVGGLDEDGVAELAGWQLGVRPAPEFVSACLQATSGNPLVLRHLLRTLRDGGVTPDAASAAGIAETTPAELGIALLARINRQDDRLVRLARAVAVVEPPTLELAAAVTGAEIAETADLTQQLASMGLFANDEVPVYAHHIVGTAVANSLSHSQRDELHALAAEHLHDAGAPHTHVAFHLQRTKTRLGPWAARTMFSAAQISIADGDPRTGEEFLRRALLEDLPITLRTEIVMCLGVVEMCSDPQLAAGHLREALEHLEDPAELAEVACRLAQLLFMEGRYESAASVLRRTIDRVEPQGGTPAALLRLGLRAAVGPAGQSAAERIDLDDLDPAWRRGGVHGRMVAALIAEEMHKSGVARDLCRDAARVALSRGVTVLMRDPQRLIMTIAALIGIDEIDLAMRSANQLVVEARRQGLALMSGLGHALRSTVHLHRGALAEALADAQLAFAPVQSGMSVHHFAHAYCVDALVRPLLHLGEVARARDLVGRYGLYGSLPRTWHHALLLNARGRVRMALGDAEGALADQLDCGEGLGRWGATSPAVRPWRSLAAHAHLALGQRTEALAMATEELRLARETGAATIIGQALLTMGSVVEGMGAISWLTEAASVLEESPARLLRAHVLHRLGAAQWQAGRQEVATTNLEAARLLAERCGAKPLLEELDRLPVDQDVHGVPPVLTGGESAGLTPHEYRVAALVVAGNSNDEVADKLSVSRRAIEYHLTNIYRKLGVRRRTQLPTVLVGADEL